MKTKYYFFKTVKVEGRPRLRALPGYEGWFTENFGGKGSVGKRPFQAHNTMKLDAVRDKIDELKLEWIDKCVILTSLILAMDAVDNTLGHFVAYLSGWSARSYRKMALKLGSRNTAKLTAAQLAIATNKGWVLG